MIFERYTIPNCYFLNFCELCKTASQVHHQFLRILRAFCAKYSALPNNRRFFIAFPCSCPKKCEEKTPRNEGVLPHPAAFFPLFSCRQNAKFLIQQALRAIQRAVGPLPRHQLRVTARFCDAAIFNDDDPVRTADR